MTKQEFIQQYRTSSRGQTRRMGVLAALAWGTMILIIILGMTRLRQWEVNGYFDWAASFDGYWVVGFFGFCLLFFGFAWRHASKPHAGVGCPACGARLLGISARIAVFVGNCGYCGGKILEDPLIKKSLEHHD